MSLWRCFDWAIHHVNLELRWSVNSVLTDECTNITEQISFILDISSGLQGNGYTILFAVTIRWILSRDLANKTHLGQRSHHLAENESDNKTNVILFCYTVPSINLCIVNENLIYVPMLRPVCDKMQCSRKKCTLGFNWSD